MCQSGLDLAEALRSASEDCRHPELRRVLSSIYIGVSGGKTVSDALSRHVTVFGPAYVSSIAAAEASGTMTSVLSRLAELLRNEIRLRSALISILSYPVALICITSLVMVALVFFVLPQFGSVFESMNKTPPPVTEMLLDAAKFLRGHVIAIIIAVVTTVIVAFQLLKTSRARRYVDGTVLNFVLFREATRALLAGRSFRLLGTILQSGVPLLESVRLCRSSVGNVHFRRLFESMERDVTNGRGIGGTIRESAFLPSGVSQMVSTAERTGRLGVVLEMIGEYYEEDGERRLRQVIKILEPLVIMFMGVIVAGVVLSIMLPLLDVTTTTN